MPAGKFGYQSWVQINHWCKKRDQVNSAVLHKIPAKTYKNPPKNAIPINIGQGEYNLSIAKPETFSLQTET